MSDSIEVQQPGQAGEYERWVLELKLASKTTNEWFERARKIVRRYRDERDSVEKEYYRLNILWANVQTLFPAIYAKTPKADVSRRFNQNDPVGRVASLIVERALNFEIEHYSDFDSAMRGAVEDRLLPGCGTAWVRYEPKTEPIVSLNGEGEPQQETLTDDVEQPERIVSERSPCDYVYWEDFGMSPARTWEEVRWVYRRVYLSRDEGVKRFGEKFNNVPLDHTPPNLKDSEKVMKVQDTFKKAEIYEIWDKDGQQILWISKSYHSILDRKDDPLKLEGFFPLPKPLLATTTTGSMVPVPDYTEYQDQARELDLLSDRIHMLTKAIKVVGVYNAGAKDIARMLNEGIDNQLIPVDSWAMFAEAGGIKGNVDWLPIDQIVAARQALSEERDNLIQQIFQITGISDILRGQTDPDETLGAQQIKASAGALRLKRAQKEVATFASGLIRLKAQIVCTLYQPETLVQLSGITPQDPDFQLIPAALQLMKTEPLKTFRIEANADSMVELDQAQDRQERVEFLQAVSQFMGQAIQGAEAMPEAIPLMGKMLLFAIRGFKIGRELEGDFEQMLGQLQPPPPKPNPEMIKGQNEMQIEQARGQNALQLENARAQTQVAIEHAKGQVQLQLKQADLAADAQAKQMEIASQERIAEMQAQYEAQANAQERDHQAMVERVKAEMQAEVDMNRDRSQAEQESLKMAQEAQLQQLEQAHKERLQQMQIEWEREKTQFDNATKVEIANISAASKVNDSATQASTAEVTRELPAVDLGPVKDAMQKVLDAAEDMRKPRKRTLIRDEKGRATGSIEEQVNE